MWAFAAKTWLAFLSSTRKERGFGGRSTTIENKMRKSLIVHIGFAKTSTKTLQKIIFPKVCETTGYKYFREDSSVEREVKLHLSRLYTGKDCRKLNIPKGTIVSAEELANSRPYKWEEFLLKNLNAFGSDAHILLTIRDPISWFTSLYVQKCVHQAKCMKPEDFFSVNPSDAYLKDMPYDFREFSYNKIIRLYKEAFETVTIVKYEDLNKLLFLDSMFDLDDIEKESLKKSYENRKLNRSFSVNAAKATFVVHKFLNSFSFILRMKLFSGILGSIMIRKKRTIIQRRLRRLHIDLPVDYEPSTDIPTENYEKAVVYMMKKFWNPFVFRILDKMMPYKKFELDVKQLPIGCVDLESEYDELPSIMTYSNPAAI